MTSKQEKLLTEKLIRPIVRKMLKEQKLKESTNRDLEYLYKLLKAYAKKLDKPLRNVVVNGNRNDPDFQKLLDIEQAWDNFIFGIDSYYQNRKKSK